MSATDSPPSPSLASIETAVYALADSSPSSTSSSPIFRCTASSATVGERPRVWVRSEVAEDSEARSSCSRRGTRTVQPLSRKCRLISPTTVGVAYVENSTPRSVSNRSTALISPIVPTWTRSSSGSPRPANRRARYSTSGRCISTSWSRTRCRFGSSSGSSVNRANSSRAISRSLRVESSPAVAMLRALIPARRA